jgi:flavin reductase (DIM6/NTAB) family NADH-FMN oxidoreductase RutF
VLWSLGTRANSMPAFSGNSHYVINILSAEQAHLAQQFASKMENRFEGVPTPLAHRTAGAGRRSAWFECHNRSQYPEGDHVIFVGEVEHCEVDPQAALVFHNGRFTKTEAF